MTTLIECTSGEATTTVGGDTYQFQRDKHGRYVCEVHKLNHRSLFLAVADHYREAPPIADEPETKPAKASKVPAAEITGDVSESLTETPPAAPSADAPAETQVDTPVEIADETKPAKPAKPAKAVKAVKAKPALAIKPKA